jgi:mRNA-degrading endonuclease toxin of MazEF toxin-antitoxin module
MNIYENEVIMLSIPHDASNPHAQCYEHPYIIAKVFDEKNCLVVPCTSVMSKKPLPTHVRLRTKWAKTTIALAEQLTTVSLNTIRTGKYKATLCEEDVKDLWDAISVQLGLREDHRYNRVKGNVFSLNSQKNNPEFTKYVVISNKMCNRHSPVWHVAPLQEHCQDAQSVFTTGGQENYINLKDIRLVSRYNLQPTGEKLKYGSVEHINRTIINFFQEKERVVCP